MSLLLHFATPKATPFYFWIQNSWSLFAGIYISVLSGTYVTIHAHISTNMGCHCAFPWVLLYTPVLTHGAAAPALSLPEPCVLPHHSCFSGMNLPDQPQKAEPSKNEPSRLATQTHSRQSLNPRRSSSTCDKPLFVAVGSSVQRRAWSNTIEQEVFMRKIQIRRVCRYQWNPLSQPWEGRQAADLLPAWACARASEQAASSSSSPLPRCPGRLTPRHTSRRAALLATASGTFQKHWNASAVWCLWNILELQTN